jgi:succinate dehydrogenase / fumarate reductase flavoprotein subunit
MAFHATLPTTEPGGPDAWRFHAEDIYRLGGCVSDADLAEVLARHAAEAFDYLDHLGVPFARRADGTVNQFVTDGSKYARACYTGPHTANHIHAALLGHFRELGLEAWEQSMVAELLPAVGGRRIAGVLLVDEHSGERAVVQARAVVLATGGAGAAFAVNVFPDDCTGDGYALAYRAGAQLVNLEFIQIGLSSVKTKLACSGSMMRALPRLVNNCGDEFLSHYFAPDMPISQIHNVLFAKGASWPVSLEEPSHRIDIAVERERAAGRRVFLDFSRNPDSFDWEALDPAILRWCREVKGLDLDDPALHQSPLHRLKAINPQSVVWLRERGIDLEAGERVEIAPAIQHFQGGVKIRIHGETTLPGLYAAGEVAGGQHGANRPGGNALLDCQVFGRIAGESAAQTAAELVPLDESASAAAVSGLTALTGEGGLRAAEVRAHAQQIVADAAGVVRTESGLRAGLKALAALRAEGLAADEHGLAYAVETRNMLDVAELVMRAALHRRRATCSMLRNW